MTTFTFAQLAIIKQLFSQESILWRATLDSASLTFISKNYRCIFNVEKERMQRKLYLSWRQCILPEDKIAATESLRERYLTPQLITSNFYRVEVDHNHVKYVRDIAFTIHSNSNLPMGRAGITIVLSEQDWHKQFQQHGYLHHETADTFRSNQLAPTHTKQKQHKIETCKQSILMSPREMEVYYYLVQYALSSKEIAQRLSLSVRTVDMHFDRLRKKLNAPSRYALLSMIDKDSFLKQFYTLR